MKEKVVLRKNLFLISLFAIFGGFFISYFGFIILIKLIFNSSNNALMIPLLFNTFLWPCVSLWILMSKNTQVAFFKVIIPSSIIILSLIFLMF